MEIQTIEQSVSSNVQIAQNFLVSTEEQNQQAGVFLKDIKTLLKQIDETFDPIIKKNYEAHKMSVSQKKKFSEPIEQSIRIISKKMSDFIMAEERKREQERLAKEAELRKLQEEQALKTAEKLETSGLKEMAEEVINIAIENTPVVEKQKIINAAGTSFRTDKKWRIVDATKIKRDFLAIDEVKINGIIRTMGKDAEQLVGGIEYYEVKVPVSRI